MASFACASVEELRKFSDSIGNYKTKIEAALRQLELDTNMLKEKLDEETIVPMEYAVKYINEIITDAGPTLKTLITQVNLYADKLAQIEAMLAARS